MRLFSGFKFEVGEQARDKYSAQKVADAYRKKGYLARVASTPKMMGGGYTVWIAKEKVDRYGRKYARR